MAVLPVTNEGAEAVIAAAEVVEQRRRPVGLSAQFASVADRSSSVEEVAA